MTSRHLTHSPLVEAIFELRWQLEPNPDSPDLRRDPYSKLLFYPFYEGLKDTYGYLETLPAASIPDELVNYKPQHRFRVAENQWPLVQIGPGLISLNVTEGYEWQDFESRANEIVTHLYQSYPTDRRPLTPRNLSLRYVNAFNFDFEQSDAFGYLSENLNVNFRFSDEAFERLGITSRPASFETTFNFRTTIPKGAVQLELKRGKRGDGTRALIWEIIVLSGGVDVPSMPDTFSTWLTQAHRVAEGIFFSSLSDRFLESIQ